MGVSGQRHAPAVLYPRGRTPGTHWIGGWVGPRAGLDAGARRKICPSGIEPQSPDRPARSQTLYCLSYRGSSANVKYFSLWSAARNGDHFSTTILTQIAGDMGIPYTILVWWDVVSINNNWSANSVTFYQNGNTFFFPHGFWKWK
jgi:hypothetical protein